MPIKKGETIVMTGDSILLTGRPATVLRAMIRGLKEAAIHGDSFPNELCDWECALADLCTEVVKGRKVFDPKLAPKTATWRGNKFKG